jgi:hypothetical protein
MGSVLDPIGFGVGLISLVYHQETECSQRSTEGRKTTFIFAASVDIPISALSAYIFLTSHRYA